MLSRHVATFREMHFAAMPYRKLRRCVLVQVLAGPPIHTWTLKWPANIGVVQAVQVVQVLFKILRIRLSTDKTVAGACIARHANRRHVKLGQKHPDQLDHLDQASSIRRSWRSIHMTGCSGGWSTWTTSRTDLLRHWLQRRAVGCIHAKHSVVPGSAP